MSDQSPSKFRMRLDEEPNDHFIQEDILNGKIEKLSHRITLVAILIPVLIVVVLVLAYLDLTRRVTSFHATGSTEVQALAESLADRFSSLSVKQAKLAETHDALSASLEKAAAEHRRDLDTVKGELGERIDRMESSKLGKQDLQKALQNVDKELDALGKALPSLKKGFQKLSADVAGLKEGLDKELTHLNGSLSDFNALMADLNTRLELTTRRVDELEAHHAALAAEKIDAAALRKALNEEKEIYRRMMGVVTTNLESQLNHIAEELEALKNRTAPGSNSPIGRNKSPAAPRKEDHRSPADVPEPGEIMEQNIQ